MGVGSIHLCEHVFQLECGRTERCVGGADGEDCGGTARAAAAGMTSRATKPRIASAPAASIARGADDKCSSVADDCCACDASIGMTTCGFDEPASCRDGYIGRPKGDGSDCMYSCYPPSCIDCSGDDDKCSSYGDDCCACDSSIGMTGADRARAPTCTDGAERRGPSAAPSIACTRATRPDARMTDGSGARSTTSALSIPAARSPTSVRQTRRRAPTPPAGRIGRTTEPACASCDDDPNRSVLTWGHGNLHVYRFSVDHDFTIYASTCSDSTDFDSNIALFDINGNLMQQNVTQGMRAASDVADAQHVGGREQAEIYCKDDFLSAGTYILVVGGAERSSGTYGITVQIDPPGGECEATCYGQTCDFWGDDRQLVRRRLRLRLLEMHVRSGLRRRERARVLELHPHGRRHLRRRVSAGRFGHARRVCRSYPRAVCQDGCMGDYFFYE